MGNKQKKYGYLVKNTALFTVSSFGTKIISFFLVPLYTHLLTTEDYGTADIISTTATLLIYIFTLNITSSVLVFAMDKREEKNSILFFGLQVFAKGSLLLAVVIFGCYVLKLFAWEPYCYLFLFLSFASTGLNEILNNYLRAIDKVMQVVISGLLVSTVTIMSNVLFLVVFRIGIIGYLLSIVLGQLFSCLYCIIVIKPPVFQYKRHLCDKKTQIEMIKYSIPLIFNGVAWWANTSLDRYFIRVFLGSGENGIYAVAMKIPTILSTCLTIFMQAWALSAIREYDREDTDGFFGITYSTLNALLVLVSSGLILINVPLARVLFAKDFFVAWKCTSALLISGIFSGMSSFVGSVFSAVKDSRIYATSTIVATAVNTVLNVILIPTWGIQGAAVATAVSFFVIFLIRMHCVKKYIKWRLNIWNDILAYSILIVQAIFEHMRGHAYIVQGILFILLLIIYRTQLIRIIRTLLSKTKLVLKKGVN